MLAGIQPLIAHAATHPDQLAFGILPAYARELDALATAAGVSPIVLRRAYLVVDAMCSAVVRLGDEGQGRPAMLARNLDFTATTLWGDGTMVGILRAVGKHAVLSIGWPGFTGVVSGMNDAGVCACVLLNRHGDAAAPLAGTPLCYRVRSMHRRCRDLRAGGGPVRLLSCGQQQFRRRRRREDRRRPVAVRRRDVARRSQGWLVLLHQQPDECRKRRPR
jgi:hypothetical protein